MCDHFAIAVQSATYRQHSTMFPSNFEGGHAPRVVVAVISIYKVYRSPAPHTTMHSYLWLIYMRTFRIFHLQEAKERERMRMCELLAAGLNTNQSAKREKNQQLLPQNQQYDLTRERPDSSTQSSSDDNDNNCADDFVADRVTLHPYPSIHHCYYHTAIWLSNGRFSMMISDDMEGVRVTEGTYNKNTSTTYATF